MQHLKLIRSAYLFKYPQFRLSRVMGCFENGQLPKENAVWVLVNEIHLVQVTK